MLKYSDFPKIDAHIHVTVKDPILLRTALDHNVHLITINTDTTVFPPLNEQETIALYFMKEYPLNFSYIAGFNMAGWEEKYWLNNVTNKILRSMKKGALGVKIWKSIGMDIRKKNGEFLMADDPFFFPFFEFLINHKIPLLAHLGEPRNCWLPLEEMTTHRNRIYYSKFPKFHMFLHPEYPSYEQHIKSIDAILSKFPGLNFIGAHLASLEWNYKWLAHRLDFYPNLQVDISSRLNHLQLQTINDYDGVRFFFIKYSDRLMYGTDIMDNPDKMEKSYHNDWLFFTTDNLLESEEINGKFKGIKLPVEILKKLYYNNALKYYSVLQNRLNFI